MMGAHDVLHPNAYMLDTVSLLKLAKAHHDQVGASVGETAAAGDPLRVIDLLSEGKHTLLIPHACIKEALRGTNADNVKYGIRQSNGKEWSLSFQDASFKRPESNVLAKLLEQKHRGGKIRYMTIKDFINAGILDQKQATGGIIIIETENIAEPQKDGRYQMGKGHNSEQAIEHAYSSIYNHFQSTGIRLPLVSPHIPLKKIVDDVSQRYGRNGEHSSIFSLNAAVAGLMLADVLNDREANNILRALEPDKSVQQLIQSIKSTGMSRFAAAYLDKPPSAITM